jgi:hypothetical protein
MEFTLKLKTIALRWRDILMDSAKIHDFCMERYGKPPTIFMGVNGQKLPAKKHCPAIYILPGVKKEGADQTELSYGLCVSWSIVQQNVMLDGEIKPWNENDTGKLIEFLGVYETDDFGQLIYETLQAELSDIFPISKMEYNVNTQVYWPQFPGYMVLTTDIRPGIGEEIEY